MNRKILLLFTFFSLVPVFAEETVIIPNQSIENTKGFLGFNYDRQDSNQTGKQKIINDHSFFNINIQIVKEGALFDKEDLKELKN